jgi:hypothetical protein
MAGRRGKLVGGEAYEEESYEAAEEEGDADPEDCWALLGKGEGGMDSIGGEGRVVFILKGGRENFAGGGRTEGRVGRFVRWGAWHAGMLSLGKYESQATE